MVPFTLEVSMLGVGKMLTIGLTAVSAAQAALATNELNVTVRCNGHPIPNLFVKVTDGAGNLVNATDQTNDLGVVTVYDPQDYPDPLLLFYKTPGDPYCGGVRIVKKTPTHVDLPYAPKDLPCSCSHLMEQDSDLSN